MKRKFKTAEEKKAKVTRLTENMDKAIDDYFHSPEDLMEYLRFMSQFRNYSLRGTVRKMRIYNAKPISPTIPPVLTTLRKFQGS